MCVSTALEKKFEIKNYIYFYYEHITFVMEDSDKSSSSSSNISKEGVNIKTRRKRYKKQFFVGYKPHDVCDQTRKKFGNFSSGSGKSNVSV